MALLVFVLYFVAHSPLLITKIADKYAPYYHLSYEGIDGNAITGIEIEGLKYKNQALAEHIILHWNPAGLIKKELIISNLTFEKANVDTIKSFIKSFDNNSTENVNKGKKKPFPFKIKIYNILIELEAFDEKNLAIAFLKTSLKINNLNFIHKNININDLVLNIETNLTSLHLTAESKGNTILGKAQIKPTKAFFPTYIPTLNPQALETIDIDLNVSKKSIIAELDTKIMQILKVQNIKPKPFNLDILKLKSRLEYNIETSALYLLISADILSPYTQKLTISNVFEMDKNSTFHYNGEIKIPKMMGIEDKFLKPLEHLSLNYEGNNTYLFSTLNSSKIKGTIALPFYQKADIHLESKEDFALREFVTLPKELNQTKAQLSIDMPLSFEENATLLAFANISSNLINIDANMSFLDSLNIETLAYIPKNSLLKSMNKKVKWKRLSPRPQYKVKL